MAEPDAKPTAGLRRRTRRRQIGLIVLVLLLIGAALLARAYVLWRSTPKYWDENQTFLQTAGVNALAAMADSLQARTIAEVTDAGPDGATEGYLDKDRTLHITFAELNAWLATRLESTLGGRNGLVPPQVQDCMIGVENNNLIVACRLSSGDVDQVLSASFSLAFQDGKAVLNLGSVRAGRLPLPTGFVVHQIERHSGAARIAEILNGAPFDPVQKLDARQVRLVGYQIRDHGLDLTFRTELRRKKAG